MKLRQVTGGLLALTVFGGGFACSGTGELPDETTGTISEAASVPDPFAFCASTGLNTIVGTPNNDVINGTAAGDCIIGLGGQDTINGLDGSDAIIAGEGDDVVNGGEGSDFLIGEGGQD